VWNHPIGYGCCTSPVVAQGAVYIGGGADHDLHALDAATGAELWSFETVIVASSPAVANGVVYVGSNDDNLYALDSATGAGLWSFSVPYPESATVAHGVAYFGGWDMDGGLYAVDAATGAFLFYYSQPRWVGAAPAVVDGRVYVSASNGNVYCLDLTGP